MSSNDEYLDSRLVRIESSLTRLEESVAKLAEAMVQVARLEVSLAHNGSAIERAFASIEKISQHLDKHAEVSDARFKALEEAQPVQKLVSGWVLAWIAGAVGLLCGAAAMKILGA